MTRTEAKEILREAGEVYNGSGDLARISGRVYDPIIKRACDRLREDIFKIASRRAGPYFRGDQPEPGKVYALTGGAGVPCIASGNTWAESEVKQ